MKDNHFVRGAFMVMKLGLLKYTEKYYGEVDVQWYYGKWKYK